MLKLRLVTVISVFTVLVKCTFHAYDLKRWHRSYFRWPLILSPWLVAYNADFICSFHVYFFISYYNVQLICGSIDRDSHVVSEDSNVIHVTFDNLVAYDLLSYIFNLLLRLFSEKIESCCKLKCFCQHSG